jgi:iron complex outermembrane recepter protein
MNIYDNSVTRLSQVQSWVGIPFALVILLALATFAWKAQAQQSSGDASPSADSRLMEEIVVTARRKEESIMDVPIMVSAFNSEELEQKGIGRAIDLMFNVPSLSMETRFGNLFGNFTVRGLGLGVTTYLADAPLGPTNASAPLFDMASVQVLNGPQGTAFGRSNTAGAVLMEPNAPELDQLNASAKVKTGNYDRLDVDLMFNVPIIEDTLALRVAYNSVKRDGFTDLIKDEYTDMLAELTGAGNNPFPDALDDKDQQSWRVSLRWEPGDGRFKNTLIYSKYDVDQATGGFTLTAYNPDLFLYNIPDAFGPALFGGPCGSAVDAGIEASVQECVDRRLLLMSTFKPGMAAEVARVHSSDSAKRKTLGGLDVPMTAEIDQETWINTTEYDFGKVGPTTLRVKNIFGYEESTGAVGWAVAGFGGRLFPATSITTDLSATRSGFSPSAQQNGNEVSLRMGPPAETTTNEFQLMGEIEGDRVTFNWIVGTFRQDIDLPRNLEGIRNVARFWFGVFEPGLAWAPSFNFSDGGSNDSKGNFINTSLEFGDLIPAVQSAEIEAGFRRSEDKQTVHERVVIEDIPSGNWIPGDPNTDSTGTQEGDSWRVALSVKPSDGLLVYLSRDEGYRPGGINTVLGSNEAVPNFTRTFNPEMVETWELGLKYQFATDYISQGFVNVNFFTNKFADIQRNARAIVNNRNVIWTANVAEATLEGVEIKAGITMNRWALDVNYSYNDSEYDEWIGNDPTGEIGVGDPGCLPQSPVGQCLVDNSGIGFRSNPKHQLGATVSYQLPIPSHIGQVSASLTASYRDEMFITENNTREIEAYAGLTVGETMEEASTAPSYTLINARVDWRNAFGSNFDVALWGLNLSDKIVPTSALVIPNSLGSVSKIFNRPRTYGVELTYNFER